MNIYERKNTELIKEFDRYVRELMISPKTL